MGRCPSKSRPDSATPFLAPAVGFSSSRASPGCTPPGLDPGADGRSVELDAFSPGCLFLAFDQPDDRIGRRLEGEGTPGVGKVNQ